jgi:DNA-directed RNA polymerase specialized sigma24 family protein
LFLKIVGRCICAVRPPNESDMGRFMTNDFFLANRLDEDPAVFHTRFWRCHRLLRFIACRVLGGPERADAAIENCWLKASRNPPRFEYEGAFRSWLLRVLIDEALAILRQNQPSATNEIREIWRGWREMGMKSVWGFDPDEVMRAQRLSVVSRTKNPRIAPMSNELPGFQQTLIDRYTSCAECFSCSFRNKPPSNVSYRMKEELPMNVAITVATPESLGSAVRKKSVIHGDDELKPLAAPQHILQSALAALNQGRFLEVVRHFDQDGCFRFSDHALALEFTNKVRLTEFFEKSRELFPDSRLEVIALFEDGEHAIAEWKLTATQAVPYGSISCRFPISLLGTTIVLVEKGKIVRWSDYYDQSSSRRGSLAASFTEWIEY